MSTNFFRSVKISKYIRSREYVLLMAYDIYGDLVLINEQEPKVLCKLLALGYKKIYLRTKCLNIHRNMNAKWVSPYPETSLDPYYLCLENKKLFFGNIKTVFYNPRYSTDRVLLLQYFKSQNLETLKTYTLGLVGSGISPYTIYLAPLFSTSTEYEGNLEAVRYGAINKVLNNLTGVNTLNTWYNGEPHDVIISVIPSAELQFHKKYNFNKILILYYTCLDTMIDISVKELEKTYNCKANVVKIVRPYSKLINTYRIHLLR